MLLTICIPTYNRADTLDTLLKSIIRQGNASNHHKIEILVCDNHSTDHTDSVIEQAKINTPFLLTYIRHPENKGLIKNVFSTVEHASGDYCWLMGSDDRMEDGALTRILHDIETYPDISVFIPRFNIYDSTLTKSILPGERPIDKFPDAFIARPFEQYAKDIVYEIGFLSVLIFKRKDWNSVPEVKKFELNNYYHVYKIIRIALKHPIMLIREKLVGYRSDNDSVKHSVGIYKRIRMMMEEYEVLLSDTLDHKTYIACMQQHLRFHVRGYLGEIQLNFSLRERLQVLALLFKYYKYDSFFWIKLAPAIFVPGFLVLFILNVKRRNVTQ